MTRCPSPELVHADTAPQTCGCPAAVAEAVHDIVAQAIAKRALLWVWEDEPRTARWFARLGGRESLRSHGWEWWADAEFRWCRLERIRPPDPTPADRFLAQVEVTGVHGDWLPCWQLRGLWHAEHGSLPAARRGDGIKLLLTLEGTARGRVKGCGGVVRGVRMDAAVVLVQRELGGVLL